MEKYYKILILIGVMCYHIEQLYCQDSMTGVITDICGERLYQCKNGACINETLICNGKRDCQDGDDEENCIAVRTNSSIFCAKTNGQCTCVDDYFRSNNKLVYLHLNCTDAGLTSFPKLLNKNFIHKIDLSDNNLTKLTAGMFEHLPYLDSFSLARNQINTIERNAFKNIDARGELDLSGNKLEKLTPGIFNSIGELDISDKWSMYSAENGGLQFNIFRIQLLNLKDNEIKSVEPYTFSSMMYLRFLNLAGNKITKLTSRMFKGHLMLSKLDLEENEIDSIENNTFDHFKRLNFLYLNRNKLTKLKRGMFNSPNLFLQYLDLRENEIDTIESYTFISFPTMEILDLSYNKLTKLENHAFKDLTVLKNLSLAKNQISHIEMSTFHELEELEFLDLSNNNLTKLDNHTFKNLTVLKNLSLAGNQISHIEMFTFHGLRKLEFLDLSYNKLTKLENDTFKNLFVGEYLSLAGNQISHIEISTFNGLNAWILNLTGNPLYELDSRHFLRTYSEMAVVVDDINICCQMKKPTCYSSNATYNYCEEIEESIRNMELAKYYISIGVFLLAVFIIFVAVFECDICGIKKYFFTSTNVAPNDDAQLSTVVRRSTSTLPAVVAPTTAFKE